MVATTNEWQVKDKYSSALATRIFDAQGEPTKFAMVHGRKAGDAPWEAMRPVSDRYEPISTEKLVELAKGAIGERVKEEVVRYDRNNTRVQVRLLLDGPPIRLGQSPSDAGQRWVSAGHRPLHENSLDQMLPMVQITNSYDASTSVRVNAGWMRVVCANGLMVEAFEGSGFKGIKIHTEHEMKQLISELSSWKIDSGQVSSVIKRLVKKRATDHDREWVGSRLSRIQRERMAEYVRDAGGKAISVLNFLTYLQTHELSVSREAYMQKIIDGTMQKLAA